MKEIVLLLGCNAAGKTTLAQKFVDQGYERINRDEIGGKLSNLHTHAEAAIRRGVERIVMDNTYRNPEARRPTIEVAKFNGYQVRAVWLDTDKYQSMANAVLRMVRKYGKLLDANEIKAAKDDNTFPVQAIYGYFADAAKGGFVAPSTSEGFDKVERVKFQRVWGPEYKNKGLILDFDDTIRYIPANSGCDTKFPTKIEHIAVWPERAAKLKKCRDDGYRLLGASNQSGVAKGNLTHAEAEACFAHTCKLLGVEIEVAFCPHKVPPITCYCRKPNPGMLIQWIEKYKLDPKQTIFVGDQTSDRNCATHAGVDYQSADEFFV